MKSNATVIFCQVSFKQRKDAGMGNKTTPKEGWLCNRWQEILAYFVGALAGIGIKSEVLHHHLT